MSDEPHACEGSDMLAGRLGDDRVKAIVQNVIDAVGLNPQPLPPDPPPERGAE
jgi:hypothetical protein